MDTGMRIEGCMVHTRPDLRPLARHMADRIRAAVDEAGRFRDPELEREYQEWKKSRKSEGQ